MGDSIDDIVEDQEDSFGSTSIFSDIARLNRFTVFTMADRLLAKSEAFLKYGKRDYANHYRLAALVLYSELGVEKIEPNHNPYPNEFDDLDVSVFSGISRLREITLYHIADKLIHQSGILSRNGKPYDAKTYCIAAAVIYAELGDEVATKFAFYKAHNVFE
ncbi:MAG: hypothetical protein QW594_02555 [Candidatus Woesearchaeota archaeon]